MKKYVYLVLFLFLSIFLASCDNSSNNPTAPTIDSGSIIVGSDPAGAQIFLDNSSTGKVTNDTLKNVSFGSHTITLKLDGYRDTTVSASISSDIPTANKFVVLTSTESITTYGPVKIYESGDPSPSDPSGLDLSSGNAVAISGADNQSIDIYYSTAGTGGVGYLVQSANLNQNLTRNTYFNITTGTNINDGVSSPIYPLSPPWTDHMSDVKTGKYVFLYDDDNHYSKIIITDTHQGGGPGDYSWVEVKWIYNNTVNDNRF